VSAYIVPAIWVDTLANLFAGIQIVGSRELIPGDYVHIDGAGEGFVEDINWRYTTIRDWPNRTIVVPNEKLANSIFAHYRMPTSHAIIALPFHVELDSDLDLIEQDPLTAARAAAKDLRLSAQTRDPFVRFDGFGQSRVEMTVFVEIPKGFDRVQAHNALFNACTRNCTAVLSPAARCGKPTPQKPRRRSLPRKTDKSCQFPAATTTALVSRVSRGRYHQEFPVRCTPD
jgi:small-conductance mechanosensitive channel